MRRMILIAHDAMRNDLVEWVRSRRTSLSRVDLFVDGATAGEIESRTGLPVNSLPDGPGSALRAAGKMIEEGLADLVVFFWNPRIRESGGPDSDALLRIADEREVPTALNPWTADFFLAALARGARWAAAAPRGGGGRLRRVALRVQGL